MKGLYTARFIGYRGVHLFSWKRWRHGRSPAFCWKLLPAQWVQNHDISTIS